MGLCYNYICVFTVVIVWLIKLYAMSGQSKTGSAMPEGEEVEYQVNAFCQESGSRQSQIFVSLCTDSDSDSDSL